METSSIDSLKKPENGEGDILFGFSPGNYRKHNIIFFLLFFLFLLPINESSGSRLMGETWEKNFGRNSRDRILGLAKADDGYLVTGYAVSAKRDEDILVMKLDPAGNISWGKRYGGKEYDRGYAITGSDYGSVVVGVTDNGKGRARDIWVLSLDRDGDVLWNKVIGGFEEDYGFSVKRLSDGFIIAGSTRSFNVRGQQIWVIKLNKEGKTVWDKKYGIKKINYCYDIDVTGDGFILTGSAHNGDNYDLMVLLIDRYGKKLWRRVYGGSGDEHGRSVRSLEDGFIVAGSTTSKGSGGSDAWILRLDEKGELLWERSFGRGGSDSAEKIEKSGDDFVIAGYSSERLHILKSQAWIFKVDKNGNLGWSRFFKNGSYAAGVVSDSRGYFTAGSLINPLGKGESLWAARLNKTGLIKKKKKKTINP